jgi:hypothetical protein
MVTTRTGTRASAAASVPKIAGLMVKAWHTSGRVRRKVPVQRGDEFEVGPRRQGTEFDRHVVEVDALLRQLAVVTVATRSQRRDLVPPPRARL